MKNRVNTLGVFFLLILIAFAVGECKGQSNTRTRQIRFATGVQYASDTAETVDNAGRIWYDFNTGKYRCNIDGVNTDLVGGSGGAFWPLGGTAALTSSVTINGTGATNIALNSGTSGSRGRLNLSNSVAQLLKYHTSGGTSQLSLSSAQTILSFNNDAGATKSMLMSGAYWYIDDDINFKGLEYTADYSANFTNRSLIDKEYVTDNYINNYTFNDQPGTGAVNTGFILNTNSGSDFTLQNNEGSVGVLVGQDVLLFVGENASTKYIQIQGLPTVSPCATAGSNTIWNDAGTLKICP